MNSVSQSLFAALSAGIILLTSACGESGSGKNGNNTSSSSSSSSSSASSSSSTSSSSGIAAQGLAAKYAGYFPIGAAVSSYHLDNLSAIVATDFNHLTPENAMKIADIHPAENTWNTAEADRIADLARQHGWKITGHTLLWHRQAPAWMFAGLTPKDPASIEILKTRLKTHITAMVERYADVVDNWDVVNEAISDSANKTYRDASEGSKWFEMFGSQEYIYWAFKFAQEALEAKSPGSSAGKLYYNEYTVTLKTAKILTLLDYLKNKGIQVDGVGSQSHDNLSWPAINELQTTLDAFVAAGYKMKISELDVTVYADYATGKFVGEAEKIFDTTLEAKQAARYASLFEFYRKNKTHITSVTFWGISDDNTWLDNEPVKGRNDYPLLYNDAHTAKAARGAIMNF